MWPIARMSAVLAMLTPFCCTPAQAERLLLVNPQEANLPPPAELPVSTRAVTRGPVLKLVSPSGSPAVVEGPFWLRVEFAGRGGAQPDPATLRVRYLRMFPVNITGRLKPFTSGEALEIREAELPLGTHHFVLEIQDNQGRLGTTVIEIHRR